MNGWIENAACLSGAGKLARRQRGEKNYGSREVGRKLEHLAARYQRGGSAAGARWRFLLFSFIFFWTILTFTERGGSAVAVFSSVRQVVNTG